MQYGIDITDVDGARSNSAVLVLGWLIFQGRVRLAYTTFGLQKRTMHTCNHHHELYIIIIIIIQ